MDLPNYLNNILVFFSVGIILTIIFDFFRALRKYKKFNSFQVALQDILFFIIACIVFITSIYLFLDDEIRLYVFISIIAGVIVYIKLFSKLIIKLYIVFFKTLKNIINFLLLPINFLKLILVKICKKIYKIVKKGCIKIFNMINYLCKKMPKVSFKIQKKKVGYEKKSKTKKKNKDFSNK